MRELQEPGEVRHIGVSEVPVDEPEAAREIADVVSGIESLEHPTESLGAARPTLSDADMARLDAPARPSTPGSAARGAGAP